MLPLPYRLKVAGVVLACLLVVLAINAIFWFLPSKDIGESFVRLAGLIGVGYLVGQWGGRMIFRIMRAERDRLQAQMQASIEAHMKELEERLRR